MSFGTFILILLIVFIVWPIIKGVIALMRYRNMVKTAFRQARESQTQAFRTRRPGGWKGAPQRDKKFQSDDGEYVEWEEVTEVSSCFAEDTSTNDRQEKHTNSYTRVEDVEWEDIPN